MNTRLRVNEAAPAAYNAMLAMEKYLHSTSLKPLHKELVKIRASQINGCAYCLDMHTRDARKLGETEQRIYTLNAWRDTPFFTEEERAILAFTEEVTLITGKVSDQTYNNVVALLGEVYVAELLMAIIVINGWNRMSIATELQPA